MFVATTAGFIYVFSKAVTKSTTLPKSASLTQEESPGKYFHATS
jgi:hypothetical protein